ncbi:uncharacterized protein N7500_004341 [Penicillium coprophilum]|uniref:uncharacterized protein n=1 Tax=Penicillium coprophilum TaxID=36646 RepID=UPI0023844DDD|nr:uncharacterized protein N7500_010983 [Penicillium coprophilum]XP_056536012.1 uncharacterized protein N7500_004341 [Penicillium coprophilum]KAJ5150794.1 hypothetical protein N7500_010983 [Penicillium coprophilum]KAJ5171558.1 hypothetical protein N7500_004341 [Penicillium coprophilum]
MILSRNRIYHSTHRLITITASSPTPSTTTLRSNHSPTTTPAPTKPLSTADSPASQSPTSAAAATSSSKAWIAGVVVGPIAGIALIAALILWWIYRQKRKQSLSSQEQLFMGHGHPQSLQSTGYPPQYPTGYPSHHSNGYPMETYKQMHELGTAQTPRLYELGSAGNR